MSRTIVVTYPRSLTYRQALAETTAQLDDGLFKLGYRARRDWSRWAMRLLPDKTRVTRSDVEMHYEVKRVSV